MINPRSKRIDGITLPGHPSILKKIIAAGIALIISGESMIRIPVKTSSTVSKKLLFDDMDLKYIFSDKSWQGKINA
jgi:hypothetical protein